MTGRDGAGRGLRSQRDAERPPCLDGQERGNQAAAQALDDREACGDRSIVLHRDPERGEHAASGIEARLDRLAKGVGIAGRDTDKVGELLEVGIHQTAFVKKMPVQDGR